MTTHYECLSCLFLTENSWKHRETRGFFLVCMHFPLYNPYECSCLASECVLCLFVSECLEVDEFVPAFITTTTNSCIVNVAIDSIIIAVIDVVFVVIDIVMVIIITRTFTITMQYLS